MANKPIQHTHREAYITESGPYTARSDREYTHTHAMPKGKAPEPHSHSHAWSGKSKGGTTAYPWRNVES